MRRPPPQSHDLSQPAGPPQPRAARTCRRKPGRGKPSPRQAWPPLGPPLGPPTRRWPQLACERFPVTPQVSETR